ncbi:unnamed protein product [Closterium sp. NIES-65]|nr:unnamed protein product [Closterium sp. NIES-65]
MRGRLNVLARLSRKDIAQLHARQSGGQLFPQFIRARIRALSAFEAAAAAVAALPEERMSQPRRDLHSAAHRHMAQCHLELAMLAAPAAAETDPHHHHHNQHLNASQQQHPHKQQKQHQQNHQQQQQQHAAHANDADVAGGAPITVHKQSSSKVQGKAQGKDQVNAQGKVEGKVQAKAQLKGPRRGAKMQQQAQKKGEKRGKREREKAETGLMRPAEKHGEEWSLPEMDQEGGLSGKRKFEGEGAIEGVTNGLDELDGLLGLAGLVEEEAEGREAKRVCSALDMFAAVADLELRREERLREERQREEACLLQQDSVGSLKKAAERGGMATTNHLAVMLLLYGRTEHLSRFCAVLFSHAPLLASPEKFPPACFPVLACFRGRYDEAAACLQAVLQREPQHPAALCSYSALLLATQRCHGRRLDRKAGSKLDHMQQQKPQVEQKLELQQDLQQQEQVQQRQDEEKERAPNAGVVVDVTETEGAELAPAATGTAGADATIEGGESRVVFSAAAGDLAGVSAQQCATAAVQLLPSCGFLWCNLAHAATRSGRWKQAAKCMSQALKLQPASAPLRFAAAAHRIATAAAAPLPPALASQHIRCGVAEMADAMGLPELTYGSNGVPTFSRDGASAIIFGTGAGAGPGATGAGTNVASAGAAGAFGGCHGGNRKSVLSHVPEWMAWDVVGHAHAALERRALQEIVTKTGAFVVEEEARLTVTGCSDGGSAQEGLGEEEMERGGGGNRLMALLVGAASRGEDGDGEEDEEKRCKEEEEEEEGFGSGDGGGSGEAVNEELACAVVQAEELKLAAWKKQSLMAAAGAGTGAHQLGVHALHSAIHSLASDMGDGTTMGGAAADIRDANGAVELSSTGYFAAAHSHFLRALSRHQQSTATWSSLDEHFPSTSLGLCLQLSGRLDESEAAYTRALHCPSSLPPCPSTDPSSPPSSSPPPLPPPPASASHVTWCNLSLLLRAQGRLSAALSAAHNALLLAPMHGPSLCSFALLSATAGRWKDAVDAFQRASEVFRGVQGGVERGEVVGEDGGVMEGRGEMGEGCGSGVGEVVGVGEAVREAVRVNLQVALKWQARAEEERQKANGRNEMAGPAAERASQYAAGEIPAAAAAAAPGGGAGAAATNVCPFVPAFFRPVAHAISSRLPYPRDCRRPSVARPAAFSSPIPSSIPSPISSPISSPIPSPIPSSIPSPFPSPIPSPLPPPFLSPLAYPLLRRPFSPPSPFLSPAALSLSRRPFSVTSPFLFPVALALSRRPFSVTSPFLFPVALPLVALYLSRRRSSLPSPFLSPVAYPLSLETVIALPLSPPVTHLGALALAPKCLPVALRFSPPITHLGTFALAPKCLQVTLPFSPPISPHPTIPQFSHNQLSTCVVVSFSFFVFLFLT